MWPTETGRPACGKGGPFTGLFAASQRPWSYNDLEMLDRFVPLAYTDIFRFAKNDRLLLFTDGITELANPAGELYGVERLQQFLLRERVDHLTFLDRLFAALNRFSGSDVLRGDCTAIVIDLHGGWGAGAG